jgi:hypothetical protein
VLVYLLIAAILPLAGGVVLVPAVRSGTGGTHDAGDEWYPCKGEACGCTSTEACRHHCCCHRNAQSASDTADADVGESIKDSPGYRIEFRSPKCSGGRGWLAFDADGWEATMPTGPIRDSLLVCVADSDQVYTHDCPGISPDPPPPRARFV